MFPPSPPLSLLAFPYRTAKPITEGRPQVRQLAGVPGAALVWNIADGAKSIHREVVRDRPGGVALIMVLPPVERMNPGREVLELIDFTKPNGILPHHAVPNVDDLKEVLRRPPTDLAAEITEYLAWRGIRIGSETRHVVRRTVELSAELRSITALSRGLYLSRRALGRRFESEGLPVPSHWLHFCRLLRVTLRLQNSQDNIVAAGFRLGYPDGFSLSNQLYRLTGYRPSEARKYLGWEWLLEAWLRQEAEAGGLLPEGADRSIREQPAPTEPPSVATPRRNARTSRQARRTAG